MIIANGIYTKLGNKTNCGNVIIKPLFQHAGVAYANSINGIFSLRLNYTKMHFGNPFSSNKYLVVKDNLILTNSTKESVIRFIDWLLEIETNIEHDRQRWLINIIQAGILKHKPILYYKELNEPSHANALDYLINIHRWD